MSLQVQFLTLSLMAGSGAVLGVGYDIIEVLAREFRLRRWTTAMMDIVYWLIATLFVFQVLVYANDGQVRMFVFLGLLLGVIIYAYILSRLVRLVVTRIITIIIRVLSWVMSILHTLLIKPLLYVFRLLLVILRSGSNVSFFLGKSVIQWLSYIYRWIINKF